jgi:bacterioferritin-associated ferredoxin
MLAMGQIDQSPKYGDGFYIPRDGATTFGDIQGKLPVLRVNCGKCPREGRYIVQRLIRAHGVNAKVIDWLDVITADCPKKSAHSMNDQCSARCPDLPRVS